MDRDVVSLAGAGIVLIFIGIIGELMKREMLSWSEMFCVLGFVVIFLSAILDLRRKGRLGLIVRGVYPRVNKREEK